MYFFFVSTVSWCCVKDSASSAEGFGFNFRAGQTVHNVANGTAAIFLRICVVQALSSGDGFRHSLHALS